MDTADFLFASGFVGALDLYELEWGLRALRYCWWAPLPIQLRIRRRKGDQERRERDAEEQPGILSPITKQHF
jgi:hypothetical protein